MVVTLGQQLNTGEKPTVMLYTYISHARTPDKKNKNIFSTYHNKIGLPRALSLRNLVTGYECGRVFPGGVGPGSPSRDAAN